MRILIAISCRNLVGGVEKYAQALLPPLLAQGHELGILHELPLNRNREAIDSPELGLPAWDVSAVGQKVALDAVHRWNPDVIYAHGLESTELEASLLRAKPAVLFAHNYYGTCGTGHKCHGFPEFEPCTRQFGAMCALLHYPRRCGGLNPATTWRLFRRQAGHRRKLPLYQAIITASKHMHQEYLQHGIDSAKVHLVYYPVTENRCPVQPARKKSSSAQILLIGRLTELKGGDYLIRAIAQARNTIGQLSLTIAGDGPERSKLEALAQKLDVPARFVGWIQTTQIRALMDKVDLLAVPSVWPEPFGLVGTEAGCRGLPSVAYEVGGIPDWLIPGYSGELAPSKPPTAEGLAEAIIRALADPEHYARLCRGAWEVAGRFTLEAHVQQLMPILSAAASRNHPLRHVETLNPV